MSGEVWYPVGPKDVFPETFGPFLLGNPGVREVFMKHHADLLDAAFWQRHKERILAGPRARHLPLRHRPALHAAAAARGGGRGAMSAARALRRRSLPFGGKARSAKGAR